MESNTYLKAVKEFEIYETYFKESEISIFKDEILNLVNKFGESGQSGGSAPYVAEWLSTVVKKLCLQQPITPLIGDDSEWRDVTSSPGFELNSYQNTRCCSVFKDKETGQCSYLDAIVWQGKEDWNTFTGMVEEFHSGQNIKEFPFVPKTFYIDVIDIEFDEKIHTEDDRYYEDEKGKKYIKVIKDRNQLKEVFEYYQNPN